MRDLDHLIEQAKRHVESGRTIVARQRLRIEEGTCGSLALELLQQFERSRAIFEDDLTRLLQERNHQRTTDH